MLNKFRSAHSQRPPTYSALYPAEDVTRLLQEIRQFAGENVLQTLFGNDIVLIVDDSDSMRVRWEEAGQALRGLASVAVQYDDDGIDIYFLNSGQYGPGIKSAREVDDLFSKVKPTGATPMGRHLEWHLRNYLKRCEDAEASAQPLPKPVNYIVITDGRPTDDPQSVIVQAARRLDSNNFPLAQVGIQFIQIGNSRRATAALRELDDDLNAAGIRDIVDTTPYQGTLTAPYIIKSLLGAINRRIDNKGSSAVMDQNEKIVCSSQTR